MLISLSGIPYFFIDNISAHYTLSFIVSIAYLCTRLEKAVPMSTEVLDLKLIAGHGLF